MEVQPYEDVETIEQSILMYTHHADAPDMQTVLGESRDDLAREALQPVANENDANQPDYSLTAMDARVKWCIAMTLVRVVVSNTSNVMAN